MMRVIMTGIVRAMCIMRIMRVAMFAFVMRRLSVCSQHWCVNVYLIMLIVMPVTMRVNVMFPVFHAMNDRAGSHEQQRLEEGMG